MRRAKPAASGGFRSSKMDIEGAELKVLGTADDVLRQHRPRMAVEPHAIPSARRSTAMTRARVVELLTTAGYRCTLSTQGTGIIRSCWPRRLQMRDAGAREVTRRMSIRERVVATLERLSLAITPATPCISTRLADTTGLDARAILQETCCESRWKTDGAALSGLPIPVAAWGVNPGDRRALYCLVHALKPAGCRDRHPYRRIDGIYRARTRSNRGGKGRSAAVLVTVDVVDVNDTNAKPWAAFGAPLSPRELLQSIDVEFVQFVRSDSLTYLRACTEHFDLIFLDGDHSAKTVYREVPAAAARLRPGGWILLHDYYPQLRHLCPGDTVVPGPYLALRRLQGECPDLTVLPLGDLPWPTKGEQRRPHSLSSAGRRRPDGSRALSRTRPGGRRCGAATIAAGVRPASARP